MISDRENVTPRVNNFNQERKTLSLWKREDLEDKYLRLTEELVDEKKLSKKKDGVIHELNNKFQKLANDQNKIPGNGSGSIKLRTEIEILKAKVSELGSQNSILKKKLQISQQKTAVLSTNMKSNASPRIDTGRSKRSSVVGGIGGGSGITKSQSHQQMVIRPDQQQHQQQLPPQQRHFRAWENGDVSNNVNNIYANDSAAGTAAATNNYKENLALIKLRSELATRADKFQDVSAKYDALYQNQKILEQANKDLQQELEFHKSKQGLESNNLSSVLEKRISDLEHINHEMKKEIIILRQTNDELTNRAFDTERERDWREKELKYRTRISQLEKTLKMDVGEKGGILDEYKKERDNYDKLEKEMSVIRLNNFELKQKCEDMETKLKFYAQDSNIHPDEVREAMLIIQKRRTGKLDSKEPHSNQSETTGDVQKQLLEEESRHAETIRELDKTRALLRTQYKISNDYKGEADRANKRLSEVSADCQAQLSESARLLDIRAARIRKLEAQLKDIGYGTKYAKKRVDDIERPLDDISISLEPGENVIEIHIGRLSLNQRISEFMQNESEPLLFGTWGFLHFEIQGTGVLRGTNPDFDMTAEYIVHVDEFLLDCLFKKTYAFELHQAVGTDYETLAVAQLSCKELLTDEKPLKTDTMRRYNCQARLICIPGSSLDRIDAEGSPLGVLEYWIRLRHPMNQIIRQYNEKLKALSYLDTNARAEKEANRVRPIGDTISAETHSETQSNIAPHTMSANENELLIRVLSCHGLVAKNLSQGQQPSPYFIYTFYDFPPHTSATICSSNNPQFHDLRRFPVDINHNLHRYLSSQSIQIIVMDDLDQSDSACIGYANIPLVGLCNNKKITGSYQLNTEKLPQYHSNKQSDLSNQANRKHIDIQPTIDIEIEWLQPYNFRDYTQELLSQTEPEKLVPSMPTDVSVKLDQEKLKKIKEQHQNEIQHASPSKPLSPEKEIQQVVYPTRDDNRILSPPRKSPDIPLPIPRTKPRKDINKLKQSIEEVKDLLSTSDIPMKSDPEDSQTDIVSDDIVMTDRNQQEDVVDSSIVSEKSTPISELTKEPGDEMSFTIHSVNLNEHAQQTINSIINIDTQQSNRQITDYFLYTSILMHGLTQNECDSRSFNIPTGKYPKSVDIKFSKKFDVGFKTNYKLRQYIAASLIKANKQRIKFFVVIEPVNEEEDVVDLAVTELDPNELLEQNKDLDHAQLNIYDCEDESKQLGTITVSIHLIDVLRAVKKEIPPE